MKLECPLSFMFLSPTNALLYYTYKMLKHIHYHVCKRKPHDIIISQKNPFHIRPPHFFKILLNIVLQSTP